MRNIVSMSIRAMSNYLKRGMSEKTSALGITSFQGAILAVIKDFSSKGQDVYQKDLEKIFKTSKSSMSDSLQSLESKNLITRTSLIEGDSRKKSLKLTNKGEEITVLVGTYLNEVSDDTKNKIIKEQIQENKENEKNKTFKHFLYQLIYKLLYYLSFFEVLIIIHYIIKDISLLNKILVYTFPAFFALIITIVDIYKKIMKKNH